MPALLMYNLDGDKGRAIRGICLRLKIRVQPVPPEDFGEPLGALIGAAPRTGAACGAPFADEMLLLAGFDNALLDRLLSEMRRERAQVPLKAVLTPTNIAWTSLRLHDDILRERAAIQAGARSAHREGE